MKRTLTATIAVTVALIAFDATARSPAPIDCTLTKAQSRQATKKVRTKFPQLKRQKARVASCECLGDRCESRRVSFMPFELNVSEHRLVFRLLLQTVIYDPKIEVMVIDDDTAPVDVDELSAQVRKLVADTDAAKVALACELEDGYRGVRVSCDKTEGAREDGNFARVLRARVDRSTGKLERF